MLFDLDGVLVHSVEAVDRSWRRWAQKHGLVPEEVTSVAHGRRTIDTVRRVAPMMDAESTAAEIEAEQAEDDAGIAAIDGAHQLLRQLRDHEWCIVTSATRVLALSRLEAVGLPVPAVIVTGDEVPHGKPDPSGYLRGSALLGAAPDACLVVEDSPAGVAAARAAGMRVIGVTGPGGGADLAQADALVESCAQLRISRPDQQHDLTVECRPDRSAPDPAPHKVMGKDR